MSKVAPEPAADGEPRPAKAKKAKKGKKGKKQVGWVAVLEPSTGEEYFTNTASGEILWELPEGALVVGADGSNEKKEKRKVYDPETGEGFFDELITGTSEAAKSKALQLKSFAQHMPAKVNALTGDAGKRIIFPNLHPVSPMVRVLVAENTDPPRHRLTVCLGDPADEADEYWRPVFYFYAFACEMPLTLPYTIELRREPNCNRLRQTKNPQGRDITKWDRHAPVPKGFFAFPERVPGSSEFCLDWSSGPDRYMVSDNPGRPLLGWLRCLRFQAYAATKYHVLYCQEPVPSFRVHRGVFCPVQKGWTCLFAFFAFDGGDVPGCSRFYLQQRFEPNFTTRVAKEPSTLDGWKVREKKKGGAACFLTKKMHACV